MDKLTWYDEDGRIYCRRGYEVALARLASYEATGLSPDEVTKMGMMFEDSKRYSRRLEGRLKAYGDLGTIARLRELAQADREGRCVVLPCKVGESIWVHDRDGKAREMELDPPDIRCHCKKEDNLCMALCDSKQNGVCAFRLKNDGTSIGKTIFLTREAAEKALEALKEVERDD